MNIQGLGNIANTLTSLQKAGGLDPMRSASFDNMFSNMIGGVNNNEQNVNKVSTISSTNEGLPNFDNLVSGFIGSVNQQQLTSNNLAERFVKGDDIELHEVMIAGEKAKTSLDLLVEIRNKTIDMYRELTRLQG